MSDELYTLTITKVDPKQGDRTIEIQSAPNATLKQIRTKACMQFMTPPHKCKLYNITYSPSGEIQRDNSIESFLTSTLSQIPAFVDNKLKLELYSLTGYEPPDYDPTVQTVEIFPPIIRFAEFTKPEPPKPFKRDEFFPIPAWFEDSPPQITRREIPILQSLLDKEGKVCFILDNVLSEAECKFYITNSEIVQYRTIEDEFDKNYRSGERILCKNFALAENVFKRIHPFLLAEPKMKNALPYGFGVEGRWEPHSLNECFRFVKYSVEDHFAPHKDSNFQRTVDLKSILTCMIYLNDDFEGGKTVFLDEESWNKDKSKVPTDTITPRQGSAIIFTHNVLHEGTPLLTNVKYIMRTDIIYHRYEDWSEPGWESSPEFEEMKRCYHTAAVLERDGKISESNELYDKGQNIQLERQPDLSRLKF